jgi:hypothetical protein
MLAEYIENNLNNMESFELKKYYIWLKYIDNELKIAQNKFIFFKQDLFNKLYFRKIYYLKKKLVMTHQHISINEMVNEIDNSHQRDILKRITTNSEYSKIYLSAYESCNKILTGKNKNLCGTVKILGTYDKQKEKRDEYIIKIFNCDLNKAPSDKNKFNMFTCSCGDFKFNSKKYDTICKHICFLVCKVAKILKPYFFETKKLSNDDFKLLLKKLNNINTWNDLSISKNYKKLTSEHFKQFIKPFDDCCPVCFNNFDSEDKNNILSCPCCLNYIHTECANIWLEEKNTCTICKSKCWENYPTNNG